MSDSLSWCAEQDRLAYEKKYGKRDREASKKLSKLSELPSGIFTVSELHFLLNPFGERYNWGAWTDERVKRLNEIYERVKETESFENFTL